MIRLSSCLLAVSALLTTALTGCAAQQLRVPDRFALGRDAGGYRCSAIRVWPKPETSGMSYNLICGSALASRAQGTITVLPAGVPDTAVEECGTARDASLDSVGAVTVRRCKDKALAASAVVVRFTRGGNRYRGAAVGPAVAPLERALAVIASGDTKKGDVAGATQIKLDTLAAPTSALPVDTAAAGVDIDVALRDGIALNQQSLFVEASRVLNDAIARGDAGALPSTAIELQLEAGLADSNLQLSDAARDHFAHAAQLLATNTTLDRAALLNRKLVTYRVLDLLNRRDYAGVLEQAAGAGATPATAADLFADPIALAATGGAADGRQRARLEATVGSRDAEIARYLALDAQLTWAKSVALLATPTATPDQSEAALKLSALQIDQVLELNRGKVDPTPFIYLIAQIERQGGRIEAQRGAALTGAAQKDAYRRAAARFDCATRTLKGGTPGAASGCMVSLGGTARVPIANAISISPILAETEIERASLLAKAGVSTDDVLAEFRTGVDDLVASSRDGSLAPAGLDTYLDLLADQARTNPKSRAAADFFRAIQAIGSPAIARQYAQLKNLANASGPQAALLRERSDLLRELPALRYQVEALANVTDPASDVAKRRADLVARRDQDDQRLHAIEDQLLASGALNPVDDSPADLAELRDRLGADEVYFKVAEVRGHLYGAVVGKTQTAVYRIDGDLRTLSALVTEIQSSIRDGSGTLPQFRVSYANAVFQLIAGPAQQQVATAGRIVYDPAGPIAGLPLGVLVSDKAGVQQYLAAVKAAPNNREVTQNYAAIKFLGGQSDIALALSPRSFIESRKLGQSQAAKPFLGLGDPAVAVAGAADTPIRFGPDCLIPRSDIIRAARAAAPIGAYKLANAATAFGVPDAPTITGSDFTDTDVARRGGAGGDLSQYQVLHFATHGAPEYRYKCATVPPALLTTLGGEGSDGMLTLDEVARLDLNANLVVLSACDTAASSGDSTGQLLFGAEEKSGTSLEGLVRSFLAAHARAVMATYWNVSSGEESDALFRVFYEKGRTASIGDSLKTAQAALIANPRYSHPYYWGAYFVVGDASKMMRSSPGAVAAR